MHGNPEGVVNQDEVIIKAMPAGWALIRDPLGGRHHRYRHLASQREYTVHPARFYRTDDETHVELPPGWDIRVDARGTLFFVDHNTKSVSRQDPRYNKDIDKATGFPVGWQVVKDFKNKCFYFIEEDNTFRGTYLPATMNCRSLDYKHALIRKPKPHDKMNTLIARSSGSKERFEAPVDQSWIPDSIPKMTIEERKWYRELFKSARVYDKTSSRINRSEAIRQCYSFRTIGLSKELIDFILESTDKDKNELWSPSEYAEALHTMRHILQRQRHEGQIAPALPSEISLYTTIFETCKSRDEVVITREQIIGMNTGFNETGIDLHFFGGDKMEGELDIDQFLTAYHTAMVVKGRFHGEYPCHRNMMFD
jgi:hypothetical protein